MTAPVDRSPPDRDLVERFLEMMAAEAGAAKNTIAAYRSDLMLASEHLKGRLATASPADLGRLGEHWLTLSRSSVARKSAALRRFYAFLADEGHRADDPGVALPRPGAQRALPKTLGHGDVDRLFAAIAARIARDPPDPNDLRLLALVELLYGSGLRATELVSLPRNAIAPDRPYLILRGKGGGANGWCRSRIVRVRLWRGGVIMSPPIVHGCFHPARAICRACASIS